jgi:CRP/FNR family transcriptional regulator
MVKNVTHWDQLFPSLSKSKDAAIARFKRRASTVTLRKGEPVFHVGAPCENYLLVVEGKVSVQVITETGREIVLYEVGPGESCVLTTSCLLSGEPYPAEGVADSDVTAFAVGKREFYEALDHSPYLRNFVFANLGKRFATVIARMSDVAFGSIDRRLARVLSRSGVSGDRIVLTHQELASEMGTVREVVSRHLKVFEAHGWVRLGRGYIEILNQDGLNNFWKKNRKNRV